MLLGSTGHQYNARRAAGRGFHRAMGRGNSEVFCCEGDPPPPTFLEEYDSMGLKEWGSRKNINPKDLGGTSRVVR